jgi:sialate O-acetylesterase
MKPIMTIFLRLSSVLLLACLAHAEVRLPTLFSSHMVLQRERPIHVWGWADPGEKVSATFASLPAATAQADALGRWDIFFPPQPAGGPFQLAVSSTNKITLDDILLGDIWFASGQSNMEMPLKGFPGAPINNGAEEIRAATQPSIRLLFIRQRASPYPLEDFDIEQGWSTCTPETAAKFSAVAYFFGRDLAAREHVAIGLIDSTWGGTPAEAWTSMDTLSSDSALMPVFATHAEMVNQEAALPRIVAAEKLADSAARAAHASPPPHPWHPDPSSWAPAWLYNAMVSPAVNLAIKGVIWYQGESNSRLAYAPVYQKLFPALISDWRMHWQQGNFPFLFVQISNFVSNQTEAWPIVREAQRRTLALANTGMAVTIDIGDRGNVHPSDKQTVGTRLALAARALAYGENLEYSGPAFRQTSMQDGALQVWFDHVGSGLVAHGDTLQGFEIAGSDHHFLAASAQIDGASVVLSNPQLTRPVYARYGWQNAPTLNLFNSEGLPASPFTSEKHIPPPAPALMP